MEKHAIIKLEATGSFPFQFFIEKAVPIEKDDEMILEGIASTTNVDHDSERMSSEALRAMEAAINKDGVPLRVEHSKEDSAIIGRVFKGWVDDRNQLHIQARLDKKHVVAPILYQSMKNGTKMGLSVAGTIKRAAREFVESVGKVVNTFYDVALQEVSVTPRPANYDSWLVAKSIKSPSESSERFRETPLYNEFLFENPKLDYLQVFAKSIPDEAWHKVTSTIMKNTKKEEGETTSTEKAVSRSEFNNLSSLVSKGFANMSKLLVKMTDTDAKDQVNPDEDKTVDLGEEEKAEDSTETDKEKAEDSTETEDEKSRKAEDSTETEDEKKSETSEETKDEDKEKAEDSTETEDEKSRKAEDSTQTYDLKDTEEIKRAIKSMDSIRTKLLKEEKETEGTSEETEDEEAEKAMHPVDKLVLTMAKTMSVMADSMEKTGRRIPGFEKSLINSLREDTGFQEELQKMMKVPGAKKSVSMGNVFVPNKEGTRMRLSSFTPAAEIAKSEGFKGKSFKDVYKKNFSTISSDEE